jgi:hypothetical protein
MENDKTENGSLADARSPEAPRKQQRKIDPKFIINFLPPHVTQNN